jgi:hypothetical protein
MHYDNRPLSNGEFSPTVASAALQQPVMSVEGLLAADGTWIKSHFP